MSSRSHKSRARTLPQRFGRCVEDTITDQIHGTTTIGARQNVAFICPGSSTLT